VNFLVLGFRVKKGGERLHLSIGRQFLVHYGNVIIFLIGQGIIFRNKIGIIKEFRNKIIKELLRNKLGIIKEFRNKIGIIIYF
jgi:hypothetical protein